MLRERLSEPEVESVRRRLETMRFDVDDVDLPGLRVSGFERGRPGSR